VWGVIARQAGWPVCVWHYPPRAIMGNAAVQTAIERVKAVAVNLLLLK
jgi:hypothetical protein